MTYPRPDKPGTVFLVGILQIFSGFGHIFYETPLIGALMISCAFIAIGIITAGSFSIGVTVNSAIYFVGVLLLGILAMLFFALAIARFVMGIKEIIGAFNLMRGRRRGYVRAKSMAKRDVWSIIFLNIFSLVVGIVSWILLDSKKVRMYFAKNR